MARSRVLDAEPVLVISFAAEERFLHGIVKLREAGYRVIDAYTPYPVHGLSDLLELAPSRLPIATFCFGAAGALGIWWLQHWASAVDWPLNVGGKPWDSLPAFFPAIFEMMTLFAGYGSVLTLLVLCGLWFGRAPRHGYPGATSDRFVAIVPADAILSGEAAVRALLGPDQPVIVTEESRCRGGRQ